MAKAELLMVTVPPVALNMEVEGTVRVPLMEKLAVVLNVRLKSRVRFVNISVPEAEMDEPLFMVTVPVGSKAIEPLTVSAPTIVKLAEGWLVGVVEAVRPAKVRLPVPEIAKAALLI